MAKSKKVTTEDLTVNDKLKLNNVIDLDPNTLNTKISKSEKNEIISICSHKKTISFLIDQYYQSQSYRTRCQNQMRSLIQGYDESDIDHPKFIERELTTAYMQETLNKKYIDIITNEIPICKWMRSIYGIGPIFSAFLYSKFDITKARYATEFLSYAGLNDNNNPWLGNAKAAEITKNAIEWRDEKVAPIDAKLLEWCGNKKIYGKFKSQVKRLFKITDEVYCPDIIRLAIEIGIDNTDVFMNLYENNEFEVLEWCHLQVHSDYVGELVINKVSELTNRKIGTITRGIKNAQSITKSTGSNKKYPSTKYLKSYLAMPPYNIDLKKHCYLIGDNFMKQSKKPQSLYGNIYRARKLEETANNEYGKYADEAARILASKDWSNNHSTKKYLLEGKLSPGHIDNRAKRYATKLFISHVHEAMYYDYYRTTPPQPYVISHLGHHDYIPPEVDYHQFL